MGGAGTNPAMQMSPQIANNQNPVVKQIMAATQQQNSQGNDLARRMFFNGGQGTQPQPTAPIQPVRPFSPDNGTNGWRF